MPLILSGNVASATASTGYTVANSCRFDRASSAYMAITPSAGNRRTWTFSTWVKKSSLTGNQDLITSGTAEAVVSYIYFYSSARIFAFEEYSGGYQIHMKSNAYLRDMSAWYNLIVAVDTTQGTDSNRIKMYINGTQTSFSTSTYPSENFECNINSNTLHNIGCEQNGTNCIDGYLAETVFIDGLQLGADSFGEFDSDSPTIWKPIDVSGLTFGTNGFYLDFEDSSNLGNDANGGTDLTEVNLAATDQATDTPTNNFATMNPLDNLFPGYTFSEGNCKIVTSSSSNNSFNTSTLGISSGKWYVEAKASAKSAGGLGSFMIGIVEKPSTGTTVEIGATASAYGYFSDDGNLRSNGSWSSYGNTYTAGDIIGISINLDDNELKFYKNGTVQNSGTAISITAPASNGTGFYFVAIGDYNENDNVTWEVNFGNPTFSISSAQADADGYGNMEYAFPDTDYYCLNTKNLAEYG